MNWNHIFNPFEKFSEKQLAVFALVITLAGSFIASYAGVTYDGLLSVHTPAIKSFLGSLSENAINITVCFVLLFVLGIMINKKTRCIDIAVVAMLYRTPLYVIAILANLPFIKQINGQLLERVKTNNFQIDTRDMIILLVYGCIVLAFWVYAIVLLVNGFKTATNAKKWQQFAAFTLILMIAQIISNYLTHSLIL